MKNPKGFLLLLFFLPQIGFTQDTWEHLSGPPGSAYSRIFSNENYAFIPEADFLYRSADGLSWEKINHKVSDYMCVYRDTLINILEEGSNLSFQYSFDQGENWIGGNLPVGMSRIGEVVMCSHGIYIANGPDSILYKSNDLGINWDSIVTPSSFSQMATFDETIFISSDTMLWRFNNTDETWSDITPPLPRYVPEYSEIQDFVVRDSHVIVFASHFLFLSNDHGLLWDSIEVFTPNPYDQLTLVEDALYFNGFGSITRSYDFGMHWDTIVTDFYPQPAFFTGLRNIFLGTTYDSGVFRWEDSSGLTFDNNEGLEHGSIINLAYGAGKIWAACGNGVFAYDIDDVTWSDKMQLPPSTLEYQIISANDQGWVVVADDYTGDFYFSDNQGISWDTIQPEFDFTNVQIEGDLIFAFYTHLYRSADKGQHWDTLDFAISASDIITFKGKKYVLGHGKIYDSSDNGITWDSNDLNVYNAYSLYAFENMMYLICSDLFNDAVLYTSTDGLDWTKIDDGFPEIEPFTLWYYHHPLFFRDANSCYAFLGNNGHFISTDFSSPWLDMESGLTGKDYLIVDNIIYLGTEGLYKSIIENPFITAVDDIAESSNTAFTISPNPASDLISILPDPGFKFQNTIHIHSSDGKLMKSIVSSHDAQQIDIIISDLSDGMYFVSINGENGRAVNSFVKVR